MSSGNGLNSSFSGDAPTRINVPCGFRAFSARRQVVLRRNRVEARRRNAPASASSAPGLRQHEVVCAESSGVGFLLGRRLNTVTSAPNDAASFTPMWPRPPRPITATRDPFSDPASGAASRW